MIEAHYSGLVAARVAIGDERRLKALISSLKGFTKEHRPGWQVETFYSPFPSISGKDFEWFAAVEPTWRTVTTNQFVRLMNLSESLGRRALSVRSKVDWPNAESYIINFSIEGDGRRKFGVLCKSLEMARQLFPIVAEELKSVRIDESESGVFVSYMGPECNFHIKLQLSDIFTPKRYTLGFDLVDDPDLEAGFSALVAKVPDLFGPCKATLSFKLDSEVLVGAKDVLRESGYAWSTWYQSKMPAMRQHALLTQLWRIPVFADYELRNHWQVPVLQIDLTRDSFGKRYLEFQSVNGFDFLEECFSKLELTGVDAKLERWTDAYEDRWQNGEHYG